MQPATYERKAIELFQSKDETRPHLNRVWDYVSEDGGTTLATNGHVIVIRRWGSHVAMTFPDIAKLGPKGSPDYGGMKVEPPAWHIVAKRPVVNGKSPEWRGIDPAYFALVASVEKAETKRRRATAEQRSGESHKTYRIRLGAMTACSEWCIGSDPLDGWYFRIPDDKVLWEGVIMPRRV